jgi:single-strand DNA-binding protein
MPSYNRVILMGHLTRDPELRFTPSGVTVCNFDLAVNRSYTDKAGNKKDEVCFISIVTWQKTAENCGKYLEKGRPVLIEGYLQQRLWTTPEGQKRSKHEVVADRVQFLGDGKQHGEGKAQDKRPPMSEDNVPF